MVALFGCTAKQSEASNAGEKGPAAGAVGQAELIKQGKAAYLANCISCHNQDPAKDGSVGPAVAGSDLDVLEARVLKAEYPSGFYPKRQTKLMVAMPHLKPQIQALHAYLNSLQ